MKTLYRRYRPTRLSDVVGQPQVTEPLISSLKQGKINHAYLFVGPRGTGKTSVARIFAHEVNGFPYEIEDDYVDIIEIDGASNRGIDNIRELREKVMIAPTSGKYKVYIIDEVHMLTKEAFNALLKTLEEPPEHVIFIMATTDSYKVPVTITSRAQTFTFKLADKDVMFSHLKKICEKEKIPISDDALLIVAKRGGGSFRDSLSLLDQISSLSDTEITREIVEAAMGLPEDAKISDLLEAAANGSASEITGKIKDLMASGVKPETVAAELINAIIDSNRTELYSLLSKLPEVKEPFAEAKLIVSLVPDSPRIVSETPAKPLAPKPKEEEKPKEPAKPQVVEKPIVKATGSFDWNSFLNKVKEKNDAVYLQLAKCKYEYVDGLLDLYPMKKIIYSILSRENNRRILVEAGDGVKITIHEATDAPKNSSKDTTLSAISDIMGGEVINDGGESPF